MFLSSIPFFEEKFLFSCSPVKLFLQGQQILALSLPICFYRKPRACYCLSTVKYYCLCLRRKNYFDSCIITYDWLVVCFRGILRKL